MNTVARDNGNKPAYPEQLVENRNGDMMRANCYAEVGGLTKREAFAMAAMQGIAAAERCGHTNWQAKARGAVELADFTLAELERTPNP